MKHFRRGICFLLVLAMFCSLFLTAFAAEAPEAPQTTATVAPVGEGAHSRAIPSQSGLSETEWQVVLLTNRERMKQGKSPLTVLSALQAACDIRANELTELFSHTRPDNTSCFTVLPEVGLPSNCYAGENIASGFPSAESVVDAWMNSEGHRNNILSASFTHMGAGCTGLNWVQLFFGLGKLNYSQIELLLPSQIDLRKDVDAMQITAVLTCEDGVCYLPVSNEMTDYRQNYYGAQVVTVECFGLEAQFTVTPDARAFEDIPGDAWYLEHVQFAIDNFLMNGVGNGLFKPNDPMTRAMLVTVLWRAFGENVGDVEVFNDVDTGLWYSEAVAWAAANGVVDGVAPGVFRPNGNVSREQVATIFFRFAQKNFTDVDARTDLSAFTDGAQVSSWAREAMSWCAAEGIFLGDQSGCVNPQGRASRAQVAALLQRFVELVPAP